MRPDGKTILGPLRRGESEPIQIYQLKADSEEYPIRLEGQPKQRHNMESDCSPDGKTILFCSGPA